MGYRPKRKIYNLSFAGTEHDGLEVVMRGVTVGEELRINSIARDGDGDGAAIVELMVDLLVRWNVEDENGQPVPATPEGVRSQDAAFIGDILTALRKAAGGVVDGPLPSDSTSGLPSLVESIPMEALSPSPESYATPA